VRHFVSFDRAGSSLQRRTLRTAAVAARSIRGGPPPEDPSRPSCVDADRPVEHKVRHRAARAKCARHHFTLGFARPQPRYPHFWPDWLASPAAGCSVGWGAGGGEQGCGSTETSERQYYWARCARRRYSHLMRQVFARASCECSYGRPSAEREGIVYTIIPQPDVAPRRPPTPPHARQNSMGSLDGVAFHVASEKALNSSRAIQSPQTKLMEVFETYSFRDPQTMILGQRGRASWL
jgi:hypothetical protein